MCEESNLLFPYILDILSTQPKFSETQDNILRMLKQNLKSKGIKVHHLKKEMETTLDVGKGLGILTATGDKIRMPSLLKSDDVAGWTPTEKTHSSRRRSRSRRGRRGSNKNINRGGSSGSHSRSPSHRRSRSRRHSKRY